MSTKLTRMFNAEIPLLVEGNTQCIEPLTTVRNVQIDHYMRSAHNTNI